MRSTEMIRRGTSECYLMRTFSKVPTPHQYGMNSKLSLVDRLSVTELIFRACTTLKKNGDKISIHALIQNTNKHRR